MKKVYGPDLAPSGSRSPSARIITQAMTAVSQRLQFYRRSQSWIASILPGVFLASIVALVSIGISTTESRLFGHPVVEGLVVAILLGMLIRTAWSLPDRLDEGVGFAAKEVLEVAVFLLGVSVDLPLLVRAGPALAAGIVLLVVIGLGFSYVIGRAMGLPHKLSVLVACGNAICGNSAIAAVAPAIGADSEDVASSIAFTAILGIAVVIALPFLIRPLGLSDYQYGVLVGMTVYAVPQVLAAAFPVSLLSGQVGTLVKLVRVLMLGPVVLFFALINRSGPDVRQRTNESFRITQFVPWFIIGFLLLAAFRSVGAVPAMAVIPIRSLSGWLTVVAMAALGLGVDLKVMAKVGGRVIVTVTASLLLLTGLSVGLIHVLSIR